MEVFDYPNIPTTYWGLKVRAVLARDKKKKKKKKKKLHHIN